MGHGQIIDLRAYICIGGGNFTQIDTLYCHFVCANAYVTYPPSHSLELPDARWYVTYRQYVTHTVSIQNRYIYLVIKLLN